MTILLGRRYDVIEAVVIGSLMLLLLVCEANERMTDYARMTDVNLQ